MRTATTPPDVELPCSPEWKTWRREKRLAAALVSVLALFQGALAVGLPFGGWSYGGQNPGVLPDHLRIVSAVGTIVLLVVTAALARLTPPPSGYVRMGLGGLAVYAGVMAVMNALSPSLGERFVWSPAALILLVLALRLRGAGHRRS